MSACHSKRSRPKAKEATPSEWIQSHISSNSILTDHRAKMEQVNGVGEKTGTRRIFQLAVYQSPTRNF